MFLRSFYKFVRPYGLKLGRSREIIQIVSPGQFFVLPVKYKSGLRKAYSRDVDWENKISCSNTYGFRRKVRENKMEEEDDDDNDADEGFVVNEKDKKLSSSMTEELEKEIVGDSLGQKFILKQALAEIHFHENRKNAMPLPPSIEVNKWKELISLTDARARFHYLHSLKYGKMSFEEIQALDKVMSNPLEIPEELLAEAVGDDQESRRRIKLFLFHHEMMRQEGQEVPYEVNVNQLKEIATLTSTIGFKKFMHFLTVTYHKRMVEKVLKKARSSELGSKIVNKKTQEAAECEHLYYTLGHNSINLRLNGSTVKQHLDWQGMRELHIGHPLVVDFSYLSKIKSRQYLRRMINNEANYAVSNNKAAATPFALHFTGLAPEHYKLMETVLHINEDGSNFPVAITDKHQFQLFPREKLVYLSPDSRNDLLKYDEDDIYVIGGIIDKGEDRAPLSLASAKKNGIRHARFPMRRVVGLHADLNVETCVAIMNDMKASQDWFYSFRWIPPRFFANRVRSQGGILEHKLAYRAHKALSPVTHLGTDVEDRNRRLTPRKYREMYARIVEAKSYQELEELLESLIV